MNRSSKIEEYIAKAQPFAQPILSHLRELVHKACPGVEETMKWSQPFFVYRGAIVCNMAGFKGHCNFHFWGKEISAVLRVAKAEGSGDVSSFSRITSLSDLPADRQMLAWLRQAAAFVDKGEYTSPMAGRVKKPKADVAELPAEFKSALAKNKTAAAAFKAFSATAKREYIDWVVEAKRPETRERRIATAVEWIAEGKQRNWKYQKAGK